MPAVAFLVKQVRRMWWKKLKEWAFGPKARFEVGDNVQLIIGGGELMIVCEVWSSQKLKEPLICCKWSVPATSEIRTNLFHESQLRYYNWNVQSQTSLRPIDQPIKELRPLMTVRYSKSFDLRESKMTGS